LNLFASYPNVPIYKMGFLNNWENEPLWQWISPLAWGCKKKRLGCSATVAPDVVQLRLKALLSLVCTTVPLGTTYW
jgi:hypothetical protein